MIKYLLVFALFCQGVAFAGDTKSPTQKTITYDSPTQKDSVTPVQQKVEPMASPVQKATPMNSPVQKGTMASNTCVPVPASYITELRDAEAIKGAIKRCIVRRIVKRKIANYIQDNL